MVGEINRQTETAPRNPALVPIGRSRLVPSAPTLPAAEQQALADGQTALAMAMATLHWTYCRLSYGQSSELRERLAKEVTFSALERLTSLSGTTPLARPTWSSRDGWKLWRISRLCG